MTDKPDENIFHQHLDICEQCRKQPFNLCTAGHLALIKAVNVICDENKPPRKSRA